MRCVNASSALGAFTYIALLSSVLNGSSEISRINLAYSFHVCITYCSVEK